MLPEMRRAGSLDAMTRTLFAGATVVDGTGAAPSAADITVEDGRITNVYAIRNPHKLTSMREVVPLARA